MPVDKSERRIREMFGEISPRYDFLNHFLSAGTDYYWRWRTVRSAAPHGELPVLDVCTGTGDLAVAYWRRGRARVRVVGTDFTHEMLTLARQKTAALVSRSASSASEPAAIDFVEADTQRLPFADDQFQIVSVAFGLRNVTDTVEGLAKWPASARRGPRGRPRILDAAQPRLGGALSLVLSARAAADRPACVGQSAGGLSLLARFGLGIPLRRAPGGYDEVVRTRSRDMEAADVRDRDALPGDESRAAGKPTDGRRWA